MENDALAQSCVSIKIYCSQSSLVSFFFFSFFFFFHLTLTGLHNGLTILLKLQFQNLNNLNFITETF